MLLPTTRSGMLNIQTIALAVQCLVTRLPLRAMVARCSEGRSRSEEADHKQRRCYHR